MSLTSLRGIAACLVMLFHFRGTVNDEVFYVDNYTGFFANSDLFVDFFFILSGFVISYVYFDVMAERAPGSLRRFAIHRFARLYPLHLVTLLFALATTAIVAMLAGAWGIENPHVYNRDASAFSIITNLLMIHGWSLHEGLTWNRPSWSISVEMACYMAFPFAVRLMGRPGAVAAGCLILFSAAGYAAFHVLEPHYHEAAQLGLVRGFAGFALGMAIYCLRDHASALSTGTTGTLQIMVAVLILLGLHYNQRVAVLAPGFAAMVWLCWQDRGALTGLLRHRFLVWLGDISYSIYMIHLLLYEIDLDVAAFIDAGALPQISLFGGRVDGVLHVLLLIAITLGVSALLYRAVERPMRTRVRVWLKG